MEKKETINYSTEKNRIKKCVLKFNEGKCTSVIMPAGQVYSADELRSIVTQMDDFDAVLKAEAPAATGANLPAVKLSFGQAAAFVFKGKEGTIFDRLNKIKELAESEMSEKEKVAADGLMKNMKQLFEK
jgi:hypothetical protein